MDQIDKISSEMAELLKNKRQKLLSMLNFTQLQARAIEEEDTKKLNEYISEKQKLIEEIDKLDENFVNKFSSLKSTMGISSLDEVKQEYSEPLKQLKFQLSGVQTLTEQIFTIEKENNTKLKTKYDDIKGKLKGISGGRKLVTAYKPTPKQTGGAFIDKKK